MEKKEFIAIAFDLKHKAFVVHVAAFSIDSGDEMHFSKKAQIVDSKVIFKISCKYADFADVFIPKLAVKLVEHTKINDHIIKLVDN